MPPPPDEGLDALVRRREAEARAADEAEVDRILTLPDRQERRQACLRLVRALGDGEALPPELEARVGAALSPDGGMDGHHRERDRAMAAWTVERRRLALLHGLRPVAAAGIVLAALLPFAVSAWRAGMGPGDALAAFLAPGHGLAGVVLAVVAAGALSRLVGRAGSLEGLAGLVVAAFVAGVAGLAVSLGFAS